MSKLTHESAVQMSLFEDPKLEYYREWDRQYDEEKAKAEDARMLAYERKPEPASFPAPAGNLTPPPTVEPPRHYPRQYSGASSVTPRMPKDDALVFHYANGEEALSAARKAIRGNPGYRFHRTTLLDGTDCFEVIDDNKVLERHCVTKNNRQIYTSCQCLAGRTPFFAQKNGSGS